MGAIPIAAANDSEWHESISVDPKISSGRSSQGDQAVGGLVGIAALTAVGEWLGGDEGRSFETMAESFLATQGLVHLTKVTVARDRPADNNSSNSFPSGHAAWGFAAATYLQRRAREREILSPWIMTPLIYAPAVFAAANRVESDKHWPSDVVTGAAIGTILTNWFANAHWGSDQNSQHHIFARPKARCIPQAGPDWVGIALQIRF